MCKVDGCDNSTETTRGKICRPCEEYYKKYKLRTPEVNDLYDKANGICSICLTKMEKVGAKGNARAMVVDHCHDTGKVRGVICSQCNRAMGMFGDDKDKLLRAIVHLTK